MDHDETNAQDTNITTDAATAVLNGDQETHESVFKTMKDNLIGFAEQAEKDGKPNLAKVARGALKISEHCYGLALADTTMSDEDRLEFVKYMSTTHAMGLTKCIISVMLKGDSTLKVPELDDNGEVIPTSNEPQEAQQPAEIQRGAAVFRPF